MTDAAMQSDAGLVRLRNPSVGVAIAQLRKVAEQPFIELSPKTSSPVAAVHVDRHLD